MERERDSLRENKSKDSKSKRRHRDETEDERKERKKSKKDSKRLLEEQGKFAWGKKIDDQIDAGISPADLLAQKESHSRAIRNDLVQLADRREARERSKRDYEADKNVQSATLDHSMIQELEDKEDVFFLHQALRRASIRIKDSRAKPIDILAMNLAISLGRSEELKEAIDGFDTLGLEMDITEPATQLDELSKDIRLYTSLERDPKTLEFWHAMQVIVMKEAGDEGMGKAISASVFANINNMLEKKSLAQLGALESQINTKLRSGGAIDVEYWETLLECLGVWKSKARIREMYTFMLEKRGRGGDGPTVSSMLGEKKDRVQISAGVYMDKCDVVKDVSCYDPSMSPRLTRDIVSDERTGKLDCVEEMEDYSDLLELRRYVVKMRRERESGSGNVLGPEGGIVVKKEVKKRSEKEKHSGPRFGEVEEAVANDAGLEAMIQEAKRGLDGDDEVFGEGEESALTENDKFKSRKPRYFNSVSTGFEWNKYNSTHYDTDNPPPKQVQGYKFNIFYPDLIDRTIAPTYVIQEEEAGNMDTVLIRYIEWGFIGRFKAGAPYEDIAFRIVNKEWEYGHKRGFVCMFERGVLKLHYKFKKIYTSRR